MSNLKSLVASSNLTLFAVIFSVVALLILIFAIFFIWWVDTKKRPMKEFWGIVGRGFVNFFNDIYGLFHRGGAVKTVYSDKALNYSGTEFLPIPTKAPTNQYVYEFVGWDKNGVDEQGNMVVRAIYLQRVVVCKISVFDSDKMTLLASYDVEYGSGLNLDKIKPHKTETREFSYEFVGWDKSTDAFYKDEKIYAVYKALPKRYTYKFFEENGETIVSQGTAIYGTPINAPEPPQKAPTDKGIYEFAGWVGYDVNTILTKDMQFYASYDFKPFGKVGTSSIIKKDDKGVQILKEESLSPQEDNLHEEIRKIRTIESLNFDTQKDDNKQNITEIKVGQSGIIRKRGMNIQLNEDRVEKFKRINNSAEQTVKDKDVHQKIQLMTVKKSADVAPEQQTVISLKPKKTNLTEDDVLKNMVVNKVKIAEKKGDKK